MAINSILNAEKKLPKMIRLFIIKFYTSLAKIFEKLSFFSKDY